MSELQDTLQEEKVLHAPFLSNHNKPLTKEQKEKMIDEATIHYGKFMKALGHDWEVDPNASGTPRRVAKSFVNDLISGCYAEEPVITSFDNIDKYEGVVFQGDVEVNSLCAHHHLGFVGKAYIAYIPTANGKVIGLSKINRIVEFFARRPQIQENLTTQIHNYINKVCEGNQGVAVVIECNHSCCAVRGVKHDSTMITSKLSGAFFDEPESRAEFYQFITYLKQRK